jgi:S-adenosylmethionine-diacylgycerolhomoserine-N-methlytransferase
MATDIKQGLADQAQRMDRMYTVQRHFYDLTRRYYLLGRDRLLSELPVKPGQAVLEMGCGTGRNLLRLHRTRPGLIMCGLDISREMLATAKAKLDKAGAGVSLALGPAEDLDSGRDFGRDGFAAVYFSYVLSMLPDWPKALEAAWAALAPGGTLMVVDFWDQHDLPAWFGRLLRSWLHLFGVHFRPAVLEALRLMHGQGRAELTLAPVARGYAYLARLTKLKD